ncbi:MAG: hypothetical protein MOB07_31115 [Acidobacteria bacterium]|nr:hypothetical protein [Acidobacteriota bacterium]
MNSEGNRKQEIAIQYAELQAQALGLEYLLFGLEEGDPRREVIKTAGRQLTAQMLELRDEYAKLINEIAGHTG